MIEPASDKDDDKKAAELVEEILKNIQNFMVSRYDLATSVITSRSYSYIAGERKACSLADGPVLNWWRPVRLQDVDKRRFFYQPVMEDGRLRLRHKIWSVVRAKWEDWINPEYFVKMVYSDAESRLGYGRGLLEAIYYYHYVKAKIFQEGIQGVERWAQGMLVGKIDGLRDASTGKPNDTIAATWLNVLSTMRSRHVTVFDKADDIEVIQHPGTGHQMVKDFIEYLDTAITRLILGAVLPTGGSQGVGSFARAEVEAESMEALIQFDRSMLDEALSRDLVGLVWRLNSSQFKQIGLGEAKMPRFRTSQEEKENPVQNAQVATMLINAGIPLRRDEVYRKLGWSVPGPKDEVLKNTASMVADAVDQETVEGLPGVPKDQEGSPEGTDRPASPEAKDGTKEAQGGAPAADPTKPKKVALPSLPAVKEGAK